MNTKTKNWIWFLVIMIVMVALGVYLGTSQRRELGKSFEYSLDEFREVDSDLVQYREIAPISIDLANPCAIAVDDAGNVYVGGENAVMVYPRKQRIQVEGTPGSLAIDDSGTLAVGFENHILILRPDADITEIKLPGEKAWLTSVALDDHLVYAADAGSRRIWRFDLDGGDPVEIGRPDTDEGRGFYVPSPFFDLAVGVDGSLWVVNPGYHALENYRSDGSYISGWENSSMTIEGFSGCCNPTHFALMPDGSFVTSEKGLPRIKIHNLDGSLRCVVAITGQFDDEVTGLDLAVGEDGRIYVLDPSRKQVRIFEVIK